MLKSLEDYLAGLSFEPPETHSSQHELDAGERAFIEKYLGSDTLDRLSIQNPEPVPLPELQPIEETPQPAWDLKPELIVVQPELQISSKTEPQIIVAEVKEPVETEIATAPIVEEVVNPVITVAAPDIEVAAETAVIETEVPEKTVARAESEQVEATEVAADVDVSVQQTAVYEARSAQVVAPVEPSQRDKLRQAEEIQVVSFFVSGQIFLLPVMGIQEVLRYMELVKVPQAPEFVAGAINLRGTVMPIVHLSALLTNSSSWTYDERSFIIVTGAQDMQMGLIIDKVSSMHMIPQQKIIWNVESKLGEAGEFLSALVDLDDRVCGMIAPEIIKQKLFSEI